MPVELTSFTAVANNRNVTLNWSTSGEQNNSGFEIQRSTINGQWSIAGFVHSTGNSNSQNNYFFEDRNLISGRYKYRLKQIDYNGSFEFHYLQNEVIIGVPVQFAVSQNYPNPFNPTTKINYDVPEAAKVTLKLFDIEGKQIRTLVNEFKNPGYYTIELDGFGLSSGAYFFRFESGNFFAIKKLILMK